ncbi:MAG: carboxypeptidase-like regulatory domain-containing protein, partial [Paludibacteraceae bacterium]|nr:carboxypeptidase-like regulatory domain-containing protein [Paludibacteraceae bacterium]
MKHTLLLFAAMLCVAMTAAANDAKISGRIKDANDKSAIIGATVLLLHDTVQIAGTTSDNNGKFTLNASSGEYILELSYIGYETIRMALTVNDDTHIGDILMQEGATELGEVVVESQAIIQKVDRQILLPAGQWSFCSVPLHGSLCLSMSRYTRPAVLATALWSARIARTAPSS